MDYVQSLKGVSRNETALDRSVDRKFNTSAVKCYSEAIKLDGTYADAHAGRGKAYTALGDYEKAIKDFKKACELGSDECCKILQQYPIR
jgi:tetratricopeptide (TPR) repeat protein